MNRLIIYGLLTLAWIYLTTYGVKQVLRVSSLSNCSPRLLGSARC